MHFGTVCIDDFFKYPNAIRKYADSLEYFPDEHGRWPGVRSKPLHLLSPNLFQQICEKYLDHFYPMKIQYKVSGAFQKINNKYTGGWIHNDKEYIHTTIFYLTPNPSNDSGTSIFFPKDDEFFLNLQKNDGLYKECNEKKVQSYKSEISEEEAESYRLKNNNLFKEVIRFSNVYNRCIGFDGSQWHSANDFSNIDKEEERLTLIMFWEAIVGQPTGLHRTKMSAI
jgi:hypothetical protein